MVSVILEVFEAETLDCERLCADARDLLVKVGVEALNDRDDDDDRRDADNHAEQRKRRAQLMRPDSGEQRDLSVSMNFTSEA